MNKKCVLCESQNTERVVGLERFKDGLLCLLEHTHCDDCKQDFIDTDQIDANEAEIRSQRGL